MVKLLNHVSDFTAKGFSHVRLAIEIKYQDCTVQNCRHDVLVYKGELVKRKLSKCARISLVQDIQQAHERQCQTEAERQGRQICQRCVEAINCAVEFIRDGRLILGNGEGQCRDWIFVFVDLDFDEDGNVDDERQDEAARKKVVELDRLILGRDDAVAGVEEVRVPAGQALVDGLRNGREEEDDDVDEEITGTNAGKLFCHA